MYFYRGQAEEARQAYAHVKEKTTDNDHSVSDSSGAAEGDPAVADIASQPAGSAPQKVTALHALQK